jgi:NAD(P)-dependent dehydrogenase (short-subunit alcohol dehydrogenase family)
MSPIALITGSNQGIGRATAEALAINHGFHVIITSRNVAAGEPVASSLREKGHKATAIQLDLTSEESIKAAVAFVEKEFGGLDVLINNAGILIDVQKDLSHWELYNWTFRTNVIGPGVLTEMLIPLLRKAPSGLPRIIFLTSSMGSLAYATDKSLPWYPIDYKVYDASKAAVNMLMLNFARVLEEDGGVGRVNAVCPGYVNTHLTRFDERGTSVEMGAKRIVEVAVDDGPEGVSRTFSNANGELPW